MDKTVACEVTFLLAHGLKFMHLWDTQIAQAQVEDRLKRLGFPKVAVYVVGCVTHAKDTIAGSTPGYLSDGFSKVAELLGRFWGQYPQSLQPAVIEPLATAAADLLPGEEGGSAGWEDALIWGTAYAFSVVRRNDYTKDACSEAVAALDRAYWSVFAFYHERDHVHQSEEEIQEVEMSSPVCKAEMEFQLGFLAALEAIQGQPPPYATILQQMGSGH